MNRKDKFIRRTWHVITSVDTSLLALNRLILESERPVYPESSDLDTKMFVSPILLIAACVAAQLTELFPEFITITKTGFSGNGCSRVISNNGFTTNNTVLSFIFDNAEASSLRPADKQKNCQVHLGMQYSSDYQFRVADIVQSGYARLEAGVMAHFISSYYFSEDAAKVAVLRSSLAGSAYASGQTYSQQWTMDIPANLTTDTNNYSGGPKIIWSPCKGSALFIFNSRVALTFKDPASTGELSDDNVVLKLQWRPC